MNYFLKPDHAYHRVIFEFTDKEMKDAGFKQLSFVPMPSKLEILRILQRIMDKELNKTKQLFELSIKKDLWKAKALRLIGFLNDKDKETERFRKKYEEPGQKCNRGHKNILPVKLWNCPMCTDPLREEMEKLKKEKEWMLDVLAEHYIDEVDPFVTECEARDGIVKEMYKALKDQP